MTTKVSLIKFAEWANSQWRSRKSDYWRQTHVTTFGGGGEGTSLLLHLVTPLSFSTNTFCRSRWNHVEWFRKFTVALCDPLSTICCHDTTLSKLSLNWVSRSADVTGALYKRLVWIQSRRVGTRGHGRLVAPEVTWRVGWWRHQTRLTLRQWGVKHLRVLWTTDKQKQTAEW